jgi:hypothetical protein
VAVYRVDGRQRKEFAATFREAREINPRVAEEASRRAGPTLHAYALEWIDHYAGRGANDVINDRTRREYRRLLITYALSYFEPGERLRDIDEQRARAFVDWLCRLTDEDGHRLAAGRDPRSVAPVLRPAGIDRLADLRGDRAAHRPEVSARPAHDPDQPRTRRSTRGARRRPGPNRAAVPRRSRSHTAPGQRAPPRDDPGRRARGRAVGSLPHAARRC